MDEYYYYAAAIFLISVFSITSTVIETRSVCVLNSLTMTTAYGSADNATLEGNLPFRVRCPCAPQWLL